MIIGGIYRSPNNSKSNNTLLFETIYTASQLNKDNSSLLDLVLCYDAMLINNIEYHSPLGKSDHSVIYYNYQVECMKCTRQSLLSLHMTKSYVRTATCSTLKVEANLTQILNFKANFHTEFEPFFKKKIMLTMVDTLRLSA